LHSEDLAVALAVPAHTDGAKGPSERRILEVTKSIHKRKDETAAKDKRSNVDDSAFVTELDRY
jgi:hypothetical protein